MRVLVVLVVLCFPNSVVTPGRTRILGYHHGSPTPYGKRCEAVILGRLHELCTRPVFDLLFDCTKVAACVLGAIAGG